MGGGGGLLQPPDDQQRHLLSSIRDDPEHYSEEQMRQYQQQHQQQQGDFGQPYHQQFSRERPPLISDSVFSGNMYDDGYGHLPDQRHGGPRRTVSGGHPA